MFFAHGIHQGNWSFPPLQGFAGTFLISLGTLVVSQATTAMRGAKGAGVVHPSAADLIVHGGVVAPERVQQVVWTLLTGLGFLWIVFKTHSTAEGLPEIPMELLVLMGLSSAGYLGGKLARKPGPVIRRVDVASGSVVLTISGQHISVDPRVLVDSVEVARHECKTVEPDPDSPNEFVKAIKVTVPTEIATTTDEWFSRKHVVVVINADTQRAEWQLELPTVTDITVSDADSSGRRVVTVFGSDIKPGTVVVVPSTNEELPLTGFDDAKATRWTATTSSWPAGKTDVTVKAPTGARLQHTWTPGGLPGGPPPPPDQQQVDQHLQEGDRSAEDTGTSGPGQ